ncbi:MAG: Rossmann-like and DUF2520 domain-containing protein [Bacteroidales bacterium]
MHKNSSDRFNIVVIGAGNVAYSLVPIINKAGHNVVQIVGRTPENAQELAELVKSKHTSNVSDIQVDADAYILAVPDSAILGLSKSLHKLNGIVVHTSGSTPLSVLSSLADNYGVFYPFQTFTKGRDVSLQNVPICIESNNQDTLTMLFRFSESLGARPVKMDSSTRQWLHLSGVFSCNFVNHMLAIAQVIAQEHGFSYNLLKPLIEETISKALNDNPIDNQTGPAVRGDSETIKKHVALLSNIDEDIRDLYTEISKSILNFKQSKE